MSRKLRKILKYVFALLLWRSLCIGIGIRYCYEGWHRAVIAIYWYIKTKRITFLTKASVVKNRLFVDRRGIFLKCYASFFISIIDWHFWIPIQDGWISCFLGEDKWTFVLFRSRCWRQALVYKQQTFYILIKLFTAPFAATDVRLAFQGKCMNSTIITWRVP